MQQESTKCPGETSFNSIGSVESIHDCAGSGQRVLNTHPTGGFRGLGTSPSRTVRLLVASITGSGIGIADKRAFV